jgi:hypothetical protein
VRNPRRIILITDLVIHRGFFHPWVCLPFASKLGLRELFYKIVGGLKIGISELFQGAFEDTKVTAH